jgi:glycine hydroxymethyltransferase
MGVDEMVAVGNWIATALKSPEDSALHQTIKNEVAALCDQFPVPADQ